MLTNRQQFIKLFGSLFALGIYIIISFIIKINNIKGWEYTEGIITNVNMVIFNDNNKNNIKYQPLIEYDYSVNGIKYSNNNINQNKYNEYNEKKVNLEKYLQKYKVDETISIIYNTQYPEISIIKTLYFRNWRNLLILSMIFIIIGLIGTIIIIKYKIGSNVLNVK